MTFQVLNARTIALAASYLAKQDKHLASILKRHGPPPLWGRPQGFATLAQIILEQQVSLASAASVFGRLSRAINPFDPLNVIQVGELEVRALGVTRQKASYLVRLAESLERRELRLRTLSKLDDQQAKLALMRVKGIGSWSADIYLLMALRRADIWPAGDLALATTVRELKRLRTRPSEQRLAAVAEPWRPYRAVAARMLWQHYLAKRNRTG